MLLSVIILMCTILGSYGGDLPPDIKKCPAGDNICVRDKVMEILKKFPNGNSKFGMPNISALRLENVTVSRASTNSPIQLNFKYLKLVTHGMENSVVKNTTGWTKNPNIVEADIVVPKLSISGDYETSGKILLLSLNGKGKGDVDLIDCRVQIKAKVDLEKRTDGKNYARIKKIKVVMQPKKMNIHLENLVEGSKELTDTLNTVLNENWKDVWNELSSGIYDALGQIFLNLITPVLNEISYDDFYAD